jgi:FADH2 O2-dependent halogenase
MNVIVDVAVIGSGFAGSLAALALRTMGRTVALVERGRHPRFAIGESSTPLANLLIEELADRYGLEDVRPFCKWGTWQRSRPDVACGLKRGFSFFFHEPHARFPADPGHERQLLVAASPHDEIADMHWYRPELDRELAGQAERAGAVFLDATRLDRYERDGDTTLLTGTRDETPVQIRASFVIDASGPRGFLHRALALGEAPLRWLPPTQGLYTHFTGVETWERLQPSGETPPYPVDAAALHHVFPGGWIWVLRFNNGITSAGAALTAPVAQAITAADGAAAWRRLLRSLPSVAEQFAHAHATLPFVYAPRIAFRSARVAGDGWALLPSAAGVIDPLLSTGFPLTLLGLRRLLEAFERADMPQAAELAAYERQTLTDLDATERLAGALYAVMDDPPIFKRLSLLYFAAASFSETVRRLGRADLAPGFLLCGHPEFAAGLAACCEAAACRPHGSARRALETRIDRAIEPFDAAGILYGAGRDWYPVLAEDVLASAAKLGATPDEVQRLLERTGLSPHASGRQPSRSGWQSAR